MPSTAEKRLSTRYNPALERTAHSSIIGGAHAVAGGCSRGFQQPEPVIVMERTDADTRWRCEFLDSVGRFMSSVMDVALMVHPHVGLGSRAVDPTPRRRKHDASSHPRHPQGNPVAVRDSARQAGCSLN
jgi:hypothetical protein